MSSFEKAIPIILKHEGGFVNDKNDPGGATNYGVSLRWLKSLGTLEGDFDNDGDVDAIDVQKMTKEHAMALYRKHWWDKYHYERLSSQDLATKVFDTAVNMGSSRAHKLLQHACNATIGRAALKCDGVIGEKTRGLANGLEPKHILIVFRILQAEVYRQLVKENPKLQKFLTGWLNRAAS